MAALCMVAALCSGLLPSAPPTHHSVEFSRAGKNNRLAWLALMALVVSFGSMAGLWAFTERIGVDLGVGADRVSEVLSLSLLCSLGVTLAAAWLGSRYGRASILIGGTGLILASLYLFAGDRAAHHYLLSVCLMSAGWNFALPYQMGLIGEADVSGRVTAGMAAALALGGALGPAIAGGTLSEGSFYALYVLVAVGVVLGAVIFLWVLSRLSGEDAVTSAVANSD